jgi:hypothetical protein
MEHLNRLTAFRQAVYDRVLTKRRDAQQEALDALLLSPPVRSFPELSLSPAFRRAWPSLYKGLADGEQDETAHLELIARQIPSKLVMIFPLDESAWPRPDAATLADRGFVHSATPQVDGAGIVIGHSYSVLAYCAEPQSSWTLPVSIRRVPSTSDAVEVGVAQVQALCRVCADKPGLKVVLGDGRYGNHRFLGGLSWQTAHGGLGLLVRLRSDRRLYGEPPPYAGRGRPRKHGDVFRFKDEATWPAPQEYVSFTDARYGQVELQLWEGLHARQDAETVFSVLRAQVHLERSKPPKPLWLAWIGPALPVEEIWGFYPQRGTLEASLRFRKQYLAWTRPHVQTIAASERWTRLVTLAQWTLYLSRDVVRDTPQPWQKRQVRLTPERVKQSLGGLFSQIGTPARAPKTRGKSPGWPVGRRRSPRDRHPVVRKGASKASKAPLKAAA